MEPTVDSVRQASLDKLHAMFPSIHRLSMLGLSDWKVNDLYLAQAALCYISGYLALTPAAQEPPAEGQEER